MKFFCAALALFFAYAAVVQLNDPDPIGWIVIYGSAAVLAAVQVLRPLWRPSALLVVVAIVYAGSLFPSWLREVRPVGQAFFDSEVTRELMGLLIVALSFTIVTLLARRAQLKKRN